MLIFIGGGARSGKSALALRRAAALGERRVFVATAQAFDEEMRARIDRHREERAGSMRTIEEPLDLAGALAGLRGCDVAVIDCLTLWLSNLLLAAEEDPGRYGEIGPHLAALRGAIRAAPFHTIVVSNEVGLGIVPDNALARRFRDEAGRAHQALAADADEVYLGALGLMLRLKPGPVEVAPW